MGSATRPTQPSCDSTAVIESTANYGYHFIQWNDGDTNNPRIITLTQDTAFMAMFAKNTYTLTGLSADTIRGSVSGSAAMEYLDSVSIVATANYGYHFTQWNDGTTYNPYMFAVLEDRTLTAIFVAVGEPWQDTVVFYDTAYLTLHDTSYINVPVHDTTYVDVFVHDTTVVVDTLILTEYVPVHDTTVVTLTDTVINTVYDTVINTIVDTVINIDYVYDTISNFIYDTTIMTDTLWLTQYDTIWLTDTIVIHDTVYVPENGIDGVVTLNAKVYSSDGQIVVEGAEGNTVWLYDVSGRLLATRLDDGTPLRFEAPVSGTYMIKIGNYPARKVVVIR